METPFSWTVGEEDAGQRVDVVLVRRVPAMTRRKATDAARQGQIRVNGHIAPKGRVLVKGDVVALAALPDPSDFDATPDPSLPISILLETPDFVIADKPAGVPTHPLRQGEIGTLAGALVARYPEMAGVGYSRREPGIVHRLDTGTSGVVLAARTAPAFEALRGALREGRIDKTYVALAVGHVRAPMEIRARLRTDPRDPRRVIPSDPAGPDSDPNRADPVTEVTRAERLGSFSLVYLRACRAGRHQIRAHLASIGHPLVGDVLYGGPPFEGLSRHFLHADTIQFDPPRARAESPLPADLEAVLEKLSRSPT